MKKQYFVELVGDKIQTNNDKGLTFINKEKNIIIDVLNGVDATMITRKGTTILTKHPTLGIYQGVKNGIKINFTHKAWVATLIYWA
jgi:hypothetical protein